MRSYTIGKGFDPGLFPNPATHLLTDTLLRREGLILAMHRTRFAKTRIFNLSDTCISSDATTSPVRAATDTSPLVSNIFLHAYYTFYCPMY